jgi:hypothetical protein
MRPKIQNREIVYHACMKGSRKMKKAPSETASADDLRADFHNLYGCGRDFEGNTLIDIVVRVGSLVAEIVGEEPAAAGFSQITRSLGYDVADPAGWAEALQNQAITDAYCWPMGAKLHDLNAYAYYGIALNGARTAAEREALLREQIEAVTAFMDRVPFKAWGIQSGDAGQTMERARARFALDTGEPIEAADLAHLGNVSERRIRNMMAGKEKVFASDEGRVPAADALAWLAHRTEHFRPSRWRDQNTFEDLTPVAQEIEDAIFVPVAADGSVFHPGLVRDGAFAVGRSKRESRHATYDEALAALQKLADPAWPRPTDRGTWTAVAAARWERRSRADLDHFAEAARSTATQGA